MDKFKNTEAKLLSEKEINKIKAEVKQAAIDHLNAKNAKQALSHYTKNVIAVSNEMLFPSFNKLANDIKEYYKILKEVNHASWDEIHIHVISKNSATFTAKFRYSYTNIENEKIDLKGIWSALLIRDKGEWKIRLRHESFSQL